MFSMFFVHDRHMQKNRATLRRNSSSFVWRASSSLYTCTHRTLYTRLLCKSAAQVIVMPDPLPSTRPSLTVLDRGRRDHKVKLFPARPKKNKDYRKQFMSGTSIRRRGGVCKFFFKPN